MAIKKMPMGEVLAIVFGLAVAGAASLIIRDKWSFMNPPRPMPVKKSKSAYAYDSILDDSTDVALPSGIGAPALDFSKSTYVPDRPGPTTDEKPGGNKKIWEQDPTEVQAQYGDDPSAYDTGVLNFLPGVGADTPGAGEVGIPEQTMQPQTYNVPTQKAGGEGLPEGGIIFPQTSNEQKLRNELSVAKNKNPDIRCVIDGKKVKGMKCLIGQRGAAVEAYGNPGNIIDEFGNQLTFPSANPPFQTTDVETFYARRLMVAYGD